MSVLRAQAFIQKAFKWKVNSIHIVQNISARWRSASNRKPYLRKAASATFGILKELNFAIKICKYFHFNLTF